MSSIGVLQCHSCEHRHAASDGVLTCHQCGGGLLLPTPSVDPVLARRGIGLGVWGWADSLPGVDVASRVTLGEGWTPLLRRQSSGRAAWVKFEGTGPTLSYKDRFNAVNVSVATHWGRPGVALKSTGNAGLAAAAYCAAAGLTAQVICAPQVPKGILRGIRDFGAQVQLADVERHPALLTELVADGYLPGSRSVPPDCVTPYGAEGYRTIAYELVEELGEAPSSVVMPVGGGDGLYGVHAGFELLARSGRISQVPTMFAARTTWPGASSIAFDDVGPHALDAIRSSGGRLVHLGADDIIRAVKDLERSGISPEPASASSWAAAEALSATELGDRPVALVTGSGVKWKESL